jgi:hypothetical protein
MALDSGKHVEKDVDGVRCKVVETGLTQERVDFLRGILEFNGYEVKIEEEKKKSPEDPTLFTLGVTDILFNPVLAVYQMKLILPDGRIVSPAYWKQVTKDTKRQYYEEKG